MLEKNIDDRYTELLLRYMASCIRYSVLFFASFSSFMMVE